MFSNYYFLFFFLFFFSFFLFCASRLHNLRDGVRCHFVAVHVKVLHLAIIGPLVRNVERGRDRATVRIFSAVFE